MTVVTRYALETVRRIGDVARYARPGYSHLDPGFWRLKVTTFERMAEQHREDGDEARAAECDDAAVAARRALVRCMGRVS